MTQNNLLKNYEALVKSLEDAIKLQNDLIAEQSNLLELRAEKIRQQAEELKAAHQAIYTSLTYALQYCPVSDDRLDILCAQAHMTYRLERYTETIQAANEALSFPQIKDKMRNEMMTMIENAQDKLFNNPDTPTS